jgi:hypothetical protein
MINTKRFGTELNPSGFPNGEFNKDLMATQQVATPKSKSQRRE